MLAESAIPALREHLERVRLRHEEDLRAGHGAVFPARDLSTDPRTGIVRRHHVDEATVQRAIQIAVGRAGGFYISKRSKRSGEADRRRS